MCLIKLTKFRLRPDNIGYKVFSCSHNGSNLGGEFFGIGVSYKTGIWYKSKSVIVHLEDQNIPHYKRDTYTTGFHIFTLLKDAKRWAGDNGYLRIYSVEYKDVICTGIQENIGWKFNGDRINSNVIVAKHIKLIKEYAKENYDY